MMPEKTNRRRVERLLRRTLNGHILPTSRTFFLRRRSIGNRRTEEISARCAAKRQNSRLREVFLPHGASWADEPPRPRAPPTQLALGPYSPLRVRRVV